MKSIILVLSLYLSSISGFAQIMGHSDVETHFRINGKKNSMLMPGVPSTIEIWYTNKKTDEVFKEFKIMHGKIMHMVIMKKDLSVFKHIHPFLDPVTGRFLITVNMPLADPDNFMANNTLTKPGMYMIMADVDIKHVGMRMGHKMVHVMGQDTNRVLDLDQIDSSGVTTKYYQAYNRKYLVEMKPIITPGCSGQLVEFQVNLQMQLENGSYAPVLNSQHWLTAGAHSVWVSEGLMNMHKMYFAHMHSALPENDSTFVFSFHDNKIMKPGLQKVWFQIKHMDKVLTIPVVFNYQPSPQIQCN
jgi:hypothetical protein